MMSDKKPSTGSAGAIRAAGGAFAKMEIAHEEEYFYKQVESRPFVGYVIESKVNFYF
jgi:Mitochondrial ATPase inhibitor, IATP